MSSFQVLKILIFSVENDHAEFVNTKQLVEKINANSNFG